LPLVPDASPPEVFARVFRRIGMSGPVPDIQVQYRAFAGLRSTIRLRGNRAEVRISDLLAEAPHLVLEALAEMLLARVFRRRPSREARACYLAYVFSPAVRRRIEDVRRRRGHKRLLPARGRYFDLAEIFDNLSRRFFRTRLPAPRLGWSRKRSRTILGHYDSAHGSITISRWLDSPLVPRYPVERRGHRRVVHSRAFREAEKKFPKFEQTRRRLKLICVGGLGRRALPRRDRVSVPGVTKPAGRKPPTQSS
jgi:hypothetical protein